MINHNFHEIDLIFKFNKLLQSLYGKALKFLPSINQVHKKNSNDSQHDNIVLSCRFY